MLKTMSFDITYTQSLYFQNFQKYPLNIIPSKYQAL